MAESPTRTHRFRDRAHAGRLLAERLADYAGRDDVVLALPRGGVPVAIDAKERRELQRREQGLARSRPAARSSQAARSSSSTTGERLGLRRAGGAARRPAPRAEASHGTAEFYRERAENHEAADRRGGLHRRGRRGGLAGRRPRQPLRARKSRRHVERSRRMRRASAPSCLDLAAPAWWRSSSRCCASTTTRFAPDGLQGRILRGRRRRRRAVRARGRPATRRTPGDGARNRPRRRRLDSTGTLSPSRTPAWWSTRRSTSE